MAKISVDVQEIKKGIKDRALIAAGQLGELAKKAQVEIENKIPKEFSQKEVLKKVDQVVEIVKSQEFMKNPRVQEITRKIATLSEQIEHSIAKNVTPFVNEARSRYNEFKSANTTAAAKETASTATEVKASGGPAAPKKSAKKGTTKSDV